MDALSLCNIPIFEYKLCTWKFALILSSHEKSKKMSSQVFQTVGQLIYITPYSAPIKFSKFLGG
jgi:hypothetical protein